MGLRKHRTPSGLPPVNFADGADIWNHVPKPQNDIELILKHGVWAPSTMRRTPQPAPIGHASEYTQGMFAPNDRCVNAPAVIGWWEKRRLSYNGILVGACALTLCLLWVVTFSFRYKMVGFSDAISRSDTLFDPEALAWLLISANALFTLAWWLDVAARRLRRRPSHAMQSASLLQAALVISLICLSVVEVGLLHFAIAR